MIGRTDKIHSDEKEIVLAAADNLLTSERTDEISIDAPLVVITGKLSERKEEPRNMESPVLTLTRQAIYDEIWEISVAGMAKKYDIPYQLLMKQIKSAGVPVPPSGYWTQLAYGKPTDKPGLSGAADDIVSIFCTLTKVPRELRKEKDKKDSIAKTDVEGSLFDKSNQQDEKTEKYVAEDTKGTPEAVITPELTEADTYTRYQQEYNIYHRETLYNEVWTFPVTELSQKYHVSDVAIHKVCKSLNIPTPPVGYWAKLRAGKPVAKLSLPYNGEPETKTGLRTGVIYAAQTKTDALVFMPEAERSIILAIASQMVFPGENERMHSSILAYRKKRKDWKKQYAEANYQQRQQMSHLSNPIKEISDEAAQRVFHLIDALIKAMEPLGCTLSDDFIFTISNETVSFTVEEGHSEVPHILTNEERYQLLEYEEKKRKNSWASKPQIRKYDRPFNGRLALKIYKGKTFRDSKTAGLEDSLGEIMIDLFETAEIERKDRLAREEAERLRLEEQARREERRKHYNKEVERTQALLNLADDFETARRIRQLIEAMKLSGDLYPNLSEWIVWAERKADWFDPAISRQDEMFGKREHGKSWESKKIEKDYY